MLLLLLLLSTHNNRLILQTGAQFTPIGRLLPVKFLLEILNVGLAQDIGERLLTSIAKTLDERFKEAIMGDKQYQLGDKSKEALSKAITSFTGKESYAVGDITRTVSQIIQEQQNSSNNSGSTLSSSSVGQQELTLDQDTNTALEQWDRKYLEQQEQIVEAKSSSTKNSGDDKKGKTSTT